MARKCFLIVLGAIFLVGGLFQSALAEHKPNTFTVSPFVGGYVFEGNQDQEHGFQFGLGVGYNFTRNFSLEAVVSAIDSRADEGAEFNGNVIVGADEDIDIYSVRLDALYHFPLSQSKAIPYLAAGVGLMRTEADTGAFPRHIEDDDITVNWGGGIKYFIADYMALRADLRHILDINSDDNAEDHDFFHNFSYTAGVTFYAGAPTPAPPAKE